MRPQEHGRPYCRSFNGLLRMQMGVEAEPGVARLNRPAAIRQTRKNTWTEQVF